MKKILYILVLISLSAILASCSVVAAASGRKEPDLEKIRPNQTRPVVEAELGQAIKTTATANGTEETYMYKLGDEPAPGRAALYLVGDIFTLCFAEYIFFPLEISNSGDVKEIIVEFDTKDKVRDVRTPKSN
jgi:hypothetical protein